jgi:hypothetical protein
VNIAEGSLGVIMLKFFSKHSRKRSVIAIEFCKSFVFAKKVKVVPRKLALSSFLGRESFSIFDLNLEA